MDGFVEDVFGGQNDAVEENVHGDQHMQYGFDGGDGGAPPPQPPPMDGLFGNDNIDMHSHEGGGGGGDEQGKPYDLAADDEGIFAAPDGGGGGPLLPEPNEMQEQGSAFREWRRQNMIYLEEKENKEKEMRSQIIAEADEWKRKFYEKRDQTRETNQAHNREREKLYYAQQEKFHKEADNQFWKAIAEIIPREVPNIEKRRGRKDDEKKPAVFVVQGPKPGKPTDMVRMRQILAKLKTNPPLHMRPPPPPPPPPAKEGEKDEKEKKDGGGNESSAEGAPKPDEPSAVEGKEDVENK